MRSSWVANASVVTLAFLAATGFLATAFLTTGFFSASLSLKEALTRTSLPEAARDFSCWAKVLLKVASGTSYLPLMTCERT